MSRRASQLLRVLFLCDTNAVRSQMAEALLRERLRERVDVCSAGLDPVAIDPLTVEVMAEIGIDLAGYEAKSAKRYLCRSAFDATVIVAEESERESPYLFPGTRNLLRWSCPRPPSTPFPQSERLASFRLLREQIRTRVHDWCSSPSGIAAL